MSNSPKTKQLLKILIGAAWIDGIIQPEERLYLKRRAEELELSEDPDLKFLLAELKPVPASDCYQWLRDYLGGHPQPADYQDLVEAISGLLYSDNDIQIQEAKLLTTLQTLEPTAEGHKTSLDKVLGYIQKIYRKAVSQAG